MSISSDNYENHANQQQLRRYLKVLRKNNFIIGPKLNDPSEHFHRFPLVDPKKDGLDFYTYGSTKLDIIAEIIALRAYMLIKFILSPIDKYLITPALNFALERNGYTPLRIAIGIISGIATNLHQATLELSKLGLKIVCRAISFGLNLIAVPIVHVYNNKQQQSCGPIKNSVFRSLPATPPPLRGGRDEAERLVKLNF